MRTSSVALLTILVWLQALPHPLEAGIKVSISNWNTNKTSLKFVKVINNSISTDSVISSEIYVVQDLPSLYVKMYLLINISCINFLILGKFSGIFK